MGHLRKDSVLKHKKKKKRILYILSICNVNKLRALNQEKLRILIHEKRNE